MSKSEEKLEVEAKSTEKPRKKGSLFEYEKETQTVGMKLTACAQPAKGPYTCLKWLAILSYTIVVRFLLAGS